jgi:hypothetical protein
MTVVATEDFAGAANTILKGKTTTTGGLTWVGSGHFTPDSEGIKLTGSGAAKNSSSNGNLIYVPTGSADHWAEMAFVDVSATARGVAVCVCCVDWQNFVMLAKHWSAGQLRLYKRIANSDTTLVTITGLTIVSGDFFRIDRQGTNIKVYQNGTQIGAPEGYTVADAVFTGVANAGAWSEQVSTGALFDDFAAGNFSVGASLGCATQPALNAVVQRDKGATTKALTLGGAYIGTDPTDIQWRLENEAGSLISGYDWAVISGAEIDGGSWSGVVSVPQDTARGGYIVKLRSRDSVGAELATVQTGAFTVGVLVEVDGQSNIVNQLTGTGAGLSNKCAYFDGSSWMRSITSIFSTAVAEASDLLGLPVGFFETAIAGTSVYTHVPAHGAFGDGSDWPTTVTRIEAAGGDVELSLWYQGEADITGVTSAEYQAALTARIDGIRALTGRSGATEYRHGIVVIGRNEGGSGSDAGWQLVREALAAVAAAAPGAFIIADAITYDTSGVHLTTGGYGELAYAEGRGLAWAAGSGSYDARGPVVSSATIAGSTVTVNFDLNGSTALTGSGTLTGWQFYNGSTWANATDAARVGNTVQFTGAGATHIRYLYGEDPDVSNVVRGDVKAAAASASNLPAEPTRAALAVTAGAVANLAADAVSQAGAGATLLKGVSLSGAGLAVAGGSASMSHVVPLAASAVAAAVAGGQLALAVQLSGAAIASAAASAGMSLAVPLAADGAAQAGASAELSTNASVDLSADAQASASASAVLSLTVSLSAAAVGQALASAALAKAMALGADGAAQADGAASLQVGAGTELGADATAQASAGASLWLDVPLGADALSQALGGGELQLIVVLSADALAGASSAAALAADVKLSADGQVIATAAGALQVLGALAQYQRAQRIKPERRIWTVRPQQRIWRATA